MASDKVMTLDMGASLVSWLVGAHDTRPFYCEWRRKSTARIRQRGPQSILEPRNNRIHELLAMLTKKVIRAFYQNQVGSGSLAFEFRRLRHRHDLVGGAVDDEQRARLQQVHQVHRVVRR